VYRTVEKPLRTSRVGVEQRLAFDEVGQGEQARRADVGGHRTLPYGVRHRRVRLTAVRPNETPVGEQDRYPVPVVGLVRQADPGDGVAVTPFQVSSVQRDVAQDVMSETGDRCAL
jgi:hypothetical protein